jgi:tRNA U55 pseudouridine synthase TruB
MCTKLDIECYDCFSVRLQDASLFLTILKRPHISSVLSVTDVHCSSGTYIRSLVHDIGQELESAAHVIELCRSRQSQFSLDDALRQEDWSLDKIHVSLIDAKSKRVKNEY